MKEVFSYRFCNITAVACAGKNSFPSEWSIFLELLNPLKEISIKVNEGDYVKDLLYPVLKLINFK